MGLLKFPEHGFHFGMFSLRRDTDVEILPQIYT